MCATLPRTGAGRLPCMRRVSIPSSSGHQFTAWRPAVASRRRGTGFNPFFIRASVYCAARPRTGMTSGLVSIPSSSGHQFTALLLGVAVADAGVVSIPSSSGHQFTGKERQQAARREAAVSIPSSSGHQFTGYWDRTISTCGLLTVSIPSSSGHQFTVLPFQESLKAQLDQVSIPSSSGHQFTGPRAGRARRRA